MRPRTVSREVAIVAGFSALTALMTWPWVTDLGLYCSDPGDPYLSAWVLWWDWHGTLTQPLRLFEPNVFYPNPLALTFSEHSYGIALPLFPLFALGVTPLAAVGVATLLGFVLCGYGAFRLTRTLTGSVPAAWVAGIAFAFALFRVHHLSHLPYLSAGWMPLLLEALVLFVRERSWKRAAWFGAAFLMNGLSSLHWLLLSAPPLALSAVLLALRGGVERDRKLWTRGGTALAAAALALLPFLLPYVTVRQQYGFVRARGETHYYSADPSDWLAANLRSRTWRGFGDAPNEHQLFPGALTPLLALGAILLCLPLARPPRRVAPGAPHPGALAALDALAAISGTLAVLASGATPLRVVIFGRELLRASEPDRALAVFGAALLVRLCLAWPKTLAPRETANLLDALRRPRRGDAIALGLLFTVTGFVASFGLKWPFYRFLFDHVPGFDGIRAPIRSAMVALVGLAVLAGVGAAALAARLCTRRAALGPGAVPVLCVLLLVDLRVAPLELTKGDPLPDGATRFLRDTPMRGGVVQLPSSGRGNYLWMLRAADHRKPLVNGVSGYAPKSVLRLEELLLARPIPDALLSHLESIPTSYLVVRESWLLPEERAALHEVLTRGMRSGRLRFVARHDGHVRNDVYAVVATEPAPPTGILPPWELHPQATVRPERGPEDSRLIGSVDEPEAGLEVAGPVKIRGWARIPGEDLDVELLIDGEVREPVSFSRVPRPDVCRVLPRLSDCSAAGYEALFARRPDDAGTHEVLAVFRAKDGRYRCYPIRRFVWKP